MIATPTRGSKSKSEVRWTESFFARLRGRRVYNGWRLFFAIKREVQFMRTLGVLTLLLSLLMSSAFAASAQTDLEGRRKALNDLLAEQWEYTLRNSPIYASILGAKRWNDTLDDSSQKAIEDDLEQ